MNPVAPDSCLLRKTARPQSFVTFAMGERLAEDARFGKCKK